MTDEVSENETFKTRLQLWATVLTTMLTFGTIGYALVSEINALRQDISILRERQNVSTETISKFTASGPRFTASDGDRLRTEIEKIADRTRAIETKIIIIEDRMTRK